MFLTPGHFINLPVCPSLRKELIHKIYPSPSGSLSLTSTQLSLIPFLPLKKCKLAKIPAICSLPCQTFASLSLSVLSFLLWVPSRFVDRLSSPTGFSTSGRTTLVAAIDRRPRRLLAWRVAAVNCPSRSVLLWYIAEATSRRRFRAWFFAAVNCRSRVAVVAAVKCLHSLWGILLVMRHYRDAF